MKNNFPYWIDYNRLTSDEKKHIDFDENYNTFEASLADAAYQAWHRGYISNNSEDALDAKKKYKIVNIQDNYHFIRKYFKTSWLYYILFVRLFTFKNPFTEIQAFLKCLNVKKVNIYEPAFKSQSYSQFSITDVPIPKISIILPTLNRYEYLDNVLHDLSKQTVPVYEIIIIDQSNKHQKQIYQQFKNLPLKVLYQTETGQWTARNAGIKVSVGEFLLFIDDDSRIQPHWVENHLKAIFCFNAEVSVGQTIESYKNKIFPKKINHFHYADHCDSGNSMYKRSVFIHYGLFDRQYDNQRWGDLEFGLRLYLMGCKLISTPFASRIHLKAPKGGLRQMGVWDGFKNSRIFALRPLPSVIYFFKTYFPPSYLVHYLILNLPKAFGNKRKENKIKDILTGAFIFLLTFPFVMNNLRRSFNRASRMVETGPLIEKIPR